MCCPHVSIPAIDSAFLFFPCHHVQEVALLSNPVRNVQLLGIDETLFVTMRTEEQNTGETPVHGACPVRKEDKEAYGDDVIARDAIIGV